MGGSTGTSTVGGSMGSSAPKAGGQSSAPSSYLPTAPGTGGAGALTPSFYQLQQSYGPPPSSYYQPQSQQSYGGMGSSKGTSQPAYGGTGYNTPRLPQMVQPQYGNYNVNPTINRAPPGTVYSGPSSTTYPSAPAPIPGNVYSGPTPTPTAYPSSTTVAAPAPEDYTASPTINRAPIVEAPPPPPVPPPSPEQTPVAAQEPVRQSGPVGEGYYYDANTGQTRPFNGYDDWGNPQYSDNNWKRGGAVNKSTDTVARALSLVRNVAKKDKK